MNMLQKNIPGIKKLACQGVVYNIVNKNPADPAYKYLQNLEFHVLLPPNHYTNLNSMLLCLPVKISKNTSLDKDICALI